MTVDTGFIAAELIEARREYRRLIDALDASGAGAEQLVAEEMWEQLRRVQELERDFAAALNLAFKYGAAGRTGASAAVADAAAQVCATSNA